MIHALKNTLALNLLNPQVWRQSGPTSSLFFGLLIVTTHILTLALSGGNIVLVGLFWVAILLFSVSFFAPQAGFFVLIVATVLTRYIVPTPWGNLRIEHIVLIVLLAGLGFNLLLRPTRSKFLRLDSVGILALLWIGCNFLSSLLYSPDQLSSYRICLWLIFSVLIYFLTGSLVDRFFKVETLLKWLLIVCLLEAAVGITCFFLYLGGHNIGGVQIDPVSGIPRAYGTMWEANFFGIFLASAALFWFYLWINGGLFVRKFYLLMGFLVSSFGAILSFTRSSWITLFCGVIFILVSSTKTLMHKPRIIFGLVVIIFCLSLAVNNPFLESLVSVRLLNLSATNDGTLLFRLARINLAFEDWLTSPILGLGTNSFGQRHLDATQKEAPDYLSTLFAQNLYDTGLIGFALIVGIISVIVKRSWLVINKTKDARIKALTTGLLISFLSLLLMYQTTSAFWFGFNWVYVGLLTHLYRKLFSSPPLAGLPTEIYGRS